MKKYIILLFFAPIILTAQIRVGMDLGRVATLKAGGEEIPYPGTKPENLAVSFGYEKYLIGIVGIGAEYTHDLSDEDTFNTGFLYGAARIPFPFPFIKGAVRYGYSMPMGDAGERYDPGMAFGIGLRAKLPFIPLGLEAQFMRHTLSPVESFDDFKKYTGEELEFFMNSINLSATLKL